MKKILLVVTKSEIGGAQSFVLTLAKGLQHQGFEVEVVAGSGNGSYLFDELAKLSIPYFYLSTLKRKANLIYAMQFVLDFRRFVRYKNYDVIHLNSSNTLLAAIAIRTLWKRPKLVFTMHGLSLLDKDHAGAFAEKLVWKLYFKVLLKFINNTVFVSQNNLRDAIRERILKKGTVIYNGLNPDDLTFLSQEEARKGLSNLCACDVSHSFIIGSVGRLAYPKNYRFLIKNLSEIKKVIPEAKVVVIGKGPDYDKLKAEVMQNGFANDFFFLGEILNSSMYLKAFDVFVLPSFFEGLSISLIEAVFAEIPILATNVGGNSEVVGDDKAQLFKLESIDDFTSKIKEIKNNSSLISERNKKLKEVFSAFQMVQKYTDIYLN